MRKKIKGATVKKSIKPEVKDPKEVLSLTFNDSTARAINKNAMKQDRLALTAMLEGTSEGMDENNEQSTQNALNLLGNTDDNLRNISQTAKAGHKSAGARNKDRTGYNATPLKMLTWD